MAAGGYAVALMFRWFSYSKWERSMKDTVGKAVAEALQKQGRIHEAEMDALSKYVFELRYKPEHILGAVIDREVAFRVEKQVMLQTAQAAAALDSDITRFRDSVVEIQRYMSEELRLEDMKNVRDVVKQALVSLLAEIDDCPTKPHTEYYLYLWDKIVEASRSVPWYERISEFHYRLHSSHGVRNNVRDLHRLMGVPYRWADKM